MIKESGIGFITTSHQKLMVKSPIKRKFDSPLLKSREKKSKMKKLSLPKSNFIQMLQKQKRPLNFP